MAAVTVHFTTTHEFECRGPPSSSDLKPPSTWTSFQKFNDTNGNVIDLHTFDFINGNSSMKSQGKSDLTWEGPEYNLADGFDLLKLASDEDDDDDNENKELGAHGTGGTKRSSTRWRHSRQDSESTAPKKRLQSSSSSSQAEPRPPPPPPACCVPEKQDDRPSPQAAPSFPEAASCSGQQLTRTSVVCSPSSGLGGTTERRSIEEAEMDLTPEIQCPESSSRCSESLPGKDPPVQGAESSVQTNVSLRSFESLHCKDPPVQGTESSVQENVSLIQRSKPSEQATLLAQFPSVGYSTYGTEDLASDVDPDGAPTYTDVSSQDMQTIMAIIATTQSTGSPVSQAGSASSNPNNAVLLEDLLRASEPDVTQLNQLTFPLALQSTPGKERGATHAASVSSGYMFAPPQTAGSVIPKSRRGPTATGPPTIGLSCGPPLAVAGPPECVVAFSEESGPQRLRCAVASSSCCTPVADLTRGNAACLPAWEELGTQGWCDMSPPSASRCQEGRKGYGSSNNSSSKRSRKNSCSSSSKNSSNSSKNSSNRNGPNGSYFPVTTCISSSHHPIPAQTQQTKLLSGGSVTRFQDESQAGVDRSQRNSAAASSPSSSSLPSFPCFARSIIRSFSSDSNSPQRVKKSPRAGWPDQQTSTQSCIPSPSGPPHHVSSTAFPATSTGGQLRIQRQSLCRGSCCDLQALEPTIPHMGSLGAGPEIFPARPVTRPVARVDDTSHGDGSVNTGGCTATNLLTGNTPLSAPRQSLDHGGRQTLTNLPSTNIPHSAISQSLDHGGRQTLTNLPSTNIPHSAISQSLDHGGRQTLTNLPSTNIPHSAISQSLDHGGRQTLTNLPSTNIPHSAISQSLFPSRCQTITSQSTAYSTPLCFESSETANHGPLQVTPMMRDGRMSDTPSMATMDTNDRSSLRTISENRRSSDAMNTNNELSLMTVRVNRISSEAMNTNNKSPLMTVRVNRRSSEAMNTNNESSLMTVSVNRRSSEAMNIDSISTDQFTPTSCSVGDPTTECSHLGSSASQAFHSAPSSFLGSQRDSPRPSYPVPVFLGKILDEEEGQEGGMKGRPLTGWPHTDPLSEDVLNAVCDSTGVWVTDSEGDTFLHSLSGWDDEYTADEAIYRVRDKPNFLQALNQLNRNTETPLYCAVCLRKRNLVESMLQLGAEVNTLCCYETQGQTALHRAVETGDKEMVSALLGSPSIDLNQERCSDRCSPLMLGLARHVPGHQTEDRFDIIRMMVEEEEKPDFGALEPRSGKTSFMMAVETRDVRVVDLILEAVGAEDARRLVNAQNRAGNSAVHLAAGLREVEGEEDDCKKRLLKKLVLSGGDTGLLNKEKESPNDWAGKLIREIQSELTYLRANPAPQPR